MQIKNKSQHTLFLCALFFLLMFSSAQGQIRAGASFLKVLPGARVQSMGAAHTGALDEIHAIYANPGAAGFSREWQWATTYNKWIADVYNASLILSKCIANPLSKRTRFVLGILYQGVPEFDSSDRLVENVSANDLVVSLSIGQPLTRLSPNLSLGCNIKYFKTTLAAYQASSFVFDGGLLARTPRFSLGNSLLKYGIISSGIAITQVGPDLKFDRVGTPLPQTLRAGLAFYAGTHSGLQLEITGDYYTVKDEDKAFSIGAEIRWGNRFSINGGYDFNSDLMDRITFGGTIQLDDVMTPARSLLPGRNNALKIELATVDEGEFFSRTYRGGIGHFPIRPENFSLLNPAAGDTLFERKVVLKWEQSRDPDLFDEVEYTLLMDRDSTKLASLISVYDRDVDKFFSSLTQSEAKLWKRETTKSDSFPLSDLFGGHYYWAVFAEDLNGHLRFAETNHRRIAHFYVPAPDIEIEQLEFEYSPWITEDDYHGELIIHLKNKGRLAAEDFSFVLNDSAISPFRRLSDSSDIPIKSTLFVKQFERLNPGETETIRVPWHTAALGAHQIEARATVTGKFGESDETNNRLTKTFYTIPKGFFATPDTVNIVVISRTTLDLPIIAEVCFDENSTEVKPEYLHKTTYEPPVYTLAKRLSEHRNLTITLQGFADSNSEAADVNLANRRAQAVKDTMILLGVNDNQIDILPGKVLPKRRVPANPLDAKWVFEERRYVQIDVDPEGQEILLGPVRFTDDEEISKPVVFKSDIRGALPFERAIIFCLQTDMQDSVVIPNTGLEKDIKGEFSYLADKEEAKQWLNKSINYHLTLTDTLARTFQTHDKKTFLTSTLQYREHRIILPLKFAKTNPTHRFPWQRFFTLARQYLTDPTMKFRFTGHACAVGPESVNQRLSKSRVAKFEQEFKKTGKVSHPIILGELLKRLEPTQGFGESKPLAITRLSGKQILLGDNNSPLGRKLNRRIEIEFFHPPGGK